MKIVAHLDDKELMVNNFENTDVEWLSCAVDACWEADIIFVFNHLEDFESLAGTIKIVSTGKLIVLFNDEFSDVANPSKISQFLPYCKIVSAYKKLADDESRKYESSLSAEWMIKGESNYNSISLLQLLEQVQTDHLIVDEQVQHSII